MYISDGQQKPHQNHAWSVKEIITKALANEKPMTKHMVLATEAEQLIPTPANAYGYRGAPAGTAFDPPDVELLVEGRMGDVIEVDLRRRAAFQMLGIQIVPPADQSASDPQDVKSLMEHMSGFALEPGVKDGLTGAWEGPNSHYRDFTLATEANGAVLTRDSDGNKVVVATQAPSLDDALKKEGRLYLIPNISKSDLERLRSGKTLGEKWTVGILAKVQLDATAQQILRKNNAALANTLSTKGGWAQISLDVAARDFAPTANIFFGDQPLNNPGYSAIKLKGEVKIGSTDRLDVLKVEQRLKYLGFPAMGAGNPSAQNTIQNFVVDGTWGSEEARAALLFNKVVNFTPAAGQLATPTGTRTPSGKAINATAYFTELTTRANSFALTSSMTAFSYLNAYNADSLSSVIADADTGNQPILNSQEVFMFDYFVPPQLSTEPPALMAQAISPKPRMLKPFTFCRDVESGVLNSTANAFTVFRNNEWIKPEEVINPHNKVRLIQAPMHGKVTLHDGITPIEVGTTETGINSYTHQFIPTENYIGKDRAVFEVEAKNKKYRVIVNFWVMSTVFDDGKGDTNCKREKFGLISDMRQSIASWQQSADLSALLAAASEVTYSFSDLPATALGQTTGEGASAQITLDNNAAGHDWYIDPTPLDNSDEYLPTSDPTVFKAKAGSATDGKMDMLSVLLHEYGHTLGLEHSANSRDFMAARLQPGVRRLPSADELSLMARLVAELKGDDQSGQALTAAGTRRGTESKARPILSPHRPGQSSVCCLPALCAAAPTHRPPQAWQARQAQQGPPIPIT